MNPEYATGYGTCMVEGSAIGTQRAPSFEKNVGGPEKKIIIIITS
jgi:hypothetical protein